MAGRRLTRCLPSVLPTSSRDRKLSDKSSRRRMALEGDGQLQDADDAAIVVDLDGTAINVVVDPGDVAV